MIRKILLIILVCSMAFLSIPPLGARAAATNVVPMSKAAVAVLAAVAEKGGMKFPDAATASKFAKGFEYTTRGNVIYLNGINGLKATGKRATRVVGKTGFVKYTISATAAALVMDGMASLYYGIKNSALEKYVLTYPVNVSDSGGRWAATENFYAEPLNVYTGSPPTVSDQTKKANKHLIHFYNATTNEWRSTEIYTDFSWVGTFRFTGYGNYYPKSLYVNYGQDVKYEWNSFGYDQTPYKGTMRLKVETPFGETANVLAYDTIPKNNGITYEPSVMPQEDFELWIPDPDPNSGQNPLEIIISNPDLITNPVPSKVSTPNTAPAEDFTGAPIEDGYPEVDPEPTVAPSPSTEPTEQPNPSLQPTPSPTIEPTSSVMPSTQPTNPPVIGGEGEPTTPPDSEDDEDDNYNGPAIDSPLTPEEALALGWEDVTPPLIKEYKDPKTNTIVKFNTKTWEITYTNYYEVDIIDEGKKKLGEIDEIDMENKIFYEDKAAEGLDILNPTTGLPSQTPEEWAIKQILIKTRKRIDVALKTGASTSPTIKGSKIVPDIELIRDFKEFVFRLEGDSPELREATEKVVNQLRVEYPDYKFSALYGYKGGNNNGN
ncbi:hypothetical protein [Paenibacillus ihuae]|uniref:hypothetical protein n=1 Tax=Paenibacillus ihuae TaxID=1232431 RepID=UPI000A576B04|nr:hypothetical protein [Paenibacillus ihuae]